MAPMRSASNRLPLALIHGLMCFVVVMQMLGMPTTLWTLDFATDLVESSLIEGFSLLSSGITFAPLPYAEHPQEFGRSVRFLLEDRTLLRPPSC